MSSSEHLLGSEILAQAVANLTELLQSASNQAQFRLHFNAYGSLIDQLASGAIAFPAIEVLPAATLAGANGAYAAETNKIYLSAALLGGDPQSIVGVLLEEVGHWLDHQTSADMAGDEGRLFADIVQGRTVSDRALRFLRAEDDRALLNIDGQPIAAELDEPYAGTNLNDLRSGLNQLLDALQDALESEVFANSLPLLGDTLKDSASDAVQFIAQLRTGLNDTLDELTNPNVEQIRDAIAEALGDLGVLPDVNGDGETNSEDIEVLESADDVQFTLQIGKSFADVSTAIDADIGLPNLGLSVGGTAEVDFDYGFELTIGMNRTDGFYLETSAADELSLGLEVTTPGLEAEARLGFLQFDATDLGTQFGGDFAIDLDDTSGDNRLFLPELTAIGTDYQTLIDAELTGNADIRLDLEASTGIDGLPAVSTELEVAWGFNNAIVDPTQLLGNAPDVTLKNVQLDLGSFIGDFAGPILETVRDVAQPIDDALGPVTEDLPLINESLLELARRLATVTGGNFISPEAIEFVEQFAEIVDVLAALPIGADGRSIDFGDFGLGGANLLTTDVSDISLGSINTLRPTDPTTQLPTDGTSAAFFQNLANLENDYGLDFPILDNPLSAVGLLLGSNEPVDFFTYQTPEFGFGFELNLPAVPIFGPIVLKFGGSATASAQMRFGFDSTGLQAFRDSDFNSPERLLDGFFISQPIGGDNLALGGMITAGAGVGLGFIDITVGGGIGLGIAFNVSDEADLQDGVDDGKARGAVLGDPLCLFEPSGILSAIVFAALSIDLGFFSITKRFDLASVNLIEFTLENDCSSDEPHYNVEDPDEVNPQVQAALAGAGIIDRKGTDNADIIEVRHLSGSRSDGDESVRLFGLDPEPQDYENVKLIVINGRAGNDTIRFTNGVEATGQLDGKEGNDTIVGGEGFDFLQGGAGNDVLNGAGGRDTAVYAEAPSGVTVNLATGVAIDGYGTTDTLSNLENIEGSSFGDVLTAAASGSVLDAGAGNDRLFGGAGDDVLLGGAGADQMIGGGGTDTTTYLDSEAGVSVNLVTGRGANGYANGDFLSGVENVHGSLFGDRFTGNALNNYLDGFAGDDNIVGGAGSDTLDGGEGVDWLSYRTAAGGVSVNLRTGGAAGSDAAGDTIRFALLANPIPGQPPIRATDLSSFENLEGSRFDDVLEGDRGQNTIRGLGGDDVLRAGDGDDTLIGGAGADSHDGGAGFDWVDYSGSALGVSVNLQTGVGAGGDAAGDTFVQSAPGLATAENLRGSAQADVLVGDIGVNDIAPGYSSLGTDLVVGGLGVDRLIIDYSNNAGFDVGTGLSGGYFNGSADAGFISRNTSDGAAVLDAVSFSEMERLLLIGTAFNDSIASGAGDDLLVMGAGDDVVLGGRGSNSIFAGEGNDDVTDQNDAFGEFGSIGPSAASNVINLDGGTGVDTLSIDLRAQTEAIVLTSTNPLAESNQEFTANNGAISIRNFERFRAVYTGDGDDRLTQLGRVDNDFSTGDGDDVVNAGLGIDIVDGGFGGGESGGDDLLIIDYSVDDVGGGMVAEVSGFNASNGGRYYRNTSDGQALLDQVSFDNFERFQITGTIQADQIFGGDREDVLNGNAGNDFMAGNFGADQMFGGAGDDGLLGNRGDDVLQGGDGNDFLLDRLENLSDFLAFSGGNDLMDGGSGNDYADGGFDSDQLFGGTGNDLLVGGLASDALFGGEDNDVLIGIDYGESQFPGEFPQDNPQQFFQIDTLTGNAGADQFWLGDGTFVYYDDGARSTAGLENFALITDFNPGEGDLIQLHGSATEYVLNPSPADLPTGIGIYRPEPSPGLPPELIGIVQGATSLDLAASYFVFV